MIMRYRALIPFTAFSLVLASCGGDSTSSDTTAAPATAAPTTEAPDVTDAPESTDMPMDTAAPTETDPEDSHGDADATVYPLTIDNCGREITFEKAPERVLILNGTSVAEVETMIALGLEDHILANSQSYGSSDIEGMVEKIAALPTGGLELNENFEVPKEQTLALEPDLVISTWAGGFSEAMGSVTRDELDELGINSYVTPVNCAYGAENPRPEDVEVYETQTYEASFQLIEEIGLIFDAQHDAMHFIEDAREQIAAIETPAGDPPTVLIAYPGMSMMRADGSPAVFAGPLYDSIIEAAGGVNAFDGFADFADSATINAEALAAADVDLLVVGLFMPGEDPDEYAAQIFAEFPQWDAAVNNAYTSVAETVYLGPYNAVGIQKIADALAAIG